MEYEDLLTELYTPLKNIHLMSDIIYTRYNEEWDFIQNKNSKIHVEELLALNFSIKLTVEYLLKIREKCLSEIYDKNHI